MIPRHNLQAVPSFLKLWKQPGILCIVFRCMERVLMFQTDLWLMYNNTCRIPFLRRYPDILVSGTLITGQ